MTPTNTSSIAELPVEILEKIFERALSIKYNDRSYEEVIYCSLPRNIAQVCRFWRQVALTSACVRNEIPSVNFDNPRTQARSYPKRLARLLTWSAAANLHLNVRGVFLPKYHEKIVKLIVSQSKRIVELRIRGPSAFSALYGLKGGLPCLRRLTLVIKDWDACRPLDLFEVAPSLSTLFIVTFKMPKGLQIQTQHVRRYSQITHEEGLDFKLPNVQDLQIISKETSSLNMTLPLLRRSGSYGITELELKRPLICMTSGDEVPLRDILHHTPMLEVLKISHITTNDIYSLVDQSSGQVLVPHLHTLEMSAVEMIPLGGYHGLRKLAEMRCELLPSDAQWTRIKKFTISPQHEKDPKDFQRGLEDWKGDSDESTRLISLNDRLEELHPELHEVYVSSRYRHRRKDTRWKASLAVLLDDIESLHITKSRNLSLSPLISNLMNLMLKHAHTCPLEYPQQHRIRNVMVNWKPILIEAVKNHSWVIMDKTGTITYILTELRGRADDLDYIDRANGGYPLWY